MVSLGLREINVAGWLEDTWVIGSIWMSQNIIVCLTFTWEISKP